MKSVYRRRYQQTVTIKVSIKLIFVSVVSLLWSAMSRWCDGVIHMLANISQIIKANINEKVVFEQLLAGVIVCGVSVLGKIAVRPVVVPIYFDGLRYGSSLETRFISWLEIDMLRRGWAASCTLFFVDGGRVRLWFSCRDACRFFDKIVTELILCHRRNMSGNVEVIETS